MNVLVTSFSNPFSFFCKVETDTRDVIILQDRGSEDSVQFGITHSKKEISDVDHGQYVAVFWKDKWVRGIVTMETQFLIWLVDYGKYIKPDDKTVYINLPAEYKKYPTKIFEASIHGVVPYDRVLTDDCQIKNEISTTWSKGAIEKAQTLLNDMKAVFVPIALLTTQYNDVVIGDLYIKNANGKLVNIVTELEEWPVFLERNPEIYLQNLPEYYTSRRKHRASMLKPEFADLVPAPITFHTSLSEYTALYENAQQLDETLSYTDDGTTVINKKDQEHLRLTPLEIEQYSAKTIRIGGSDKNMLNLLLDKIHVLKMCERYKDHDLNSAGRANVRSWSRIK